MKDYPQGNIEGWKSFLLPRGFTVVHEDNLICVFTGCTPKIRVELYDFYCRTDTETGGCICADFDKSYNKVSQCPVYFCNTVATDKFWSAIELLMEAGIEWSNHCGSIKEGNGYFYCDPPVEDKNKHGRKDRR